MKGPALRCPGELPGHLKVAPKRSLLNFRIIRRINNKPQSNQLQVNETNISTVTPTTHYPCDNLGFVEGGGNSPSAMKFLLATKELRGRPSFELSRWSSWIAQSGAHGVPRRNFRNPPQNRQSTTKKAYPEEG